MNNYNPYHFAQMLADPVRIPAIKQALSEIITPETTVLDLGAGTGGLTLLACSLGAKKVIAVEPNPAIQVARELVAENGWEDRVDFHEDILENLKLLPVDLIIADLRGKLPFYENNLPTMKFANDHLLKPNGWLLPAKDRIHLALSADLETYQKFTEPFKKQDFNFRTTSYNNYLTNSFYPTSITKKMLAGPSEIWTEIDYSKIDNFSCKQKVTLQSEAEKVFGFFAWFDCDLTKDISFSCGPDSNNLVYGSVFFPFPVPIELKSTEHIEIELSANYVDADYIWRWQTFLNNSNSKSFNKLFDQSNFYGTSLSESALSLLEIS